MKKDLSRMSARKLRRLVTNGMADVSTQNQRNVLLQNADNAILAKFLEGIGVLKGGGSISLLVPPSSGRLSRDLDITILGGPVPAAAEMLAERLSHGYHGFTGTVTPQDRGDTPGTAAGMRGFDVDLKYNGAPYTSIELEMAPDHSGFIRHAIGADIDPRVARTLKDIGFEPPHIMVIDPRDQLADKLHAVTRPGATRGRDLSDIKTIVDMLGPGLDLDDLRKRVRNVERCETANAHKVHMIDVTANERAFREKYAQGNSPHSFEESRDLSLRLIEQVDEDYRDKWKPTWGDVTSPDLKPETDDHRTDASPIMRNVIEDVHPGAFCTIGDRGRTKKGTDMMCAPGSDGRARWRRA